MTSRSASVMILNLDCYYQDLGADPETQGGEGGSRNIGKLHISSAYGMIGYGFF